MERHANSGAILQPAAFPSDVETNLDGTDEQELYDTATERILENMFNSIIQMELHAVAYNP